MGSPDSSSDGRGTASRPKSETLRLYHRDPVKCVKFLLRQRSYKEDMVYAAVREFNDKGECMYSEIHSGNWWWRKQASDSISAYERCILTSR